MAITEEIMKAFDALSPEQQEKFYLWACRFASSGSSADKDAAAVKEGLERKS